MWELITTIEDLPFLLVFETVVSSASKAISVWLIRCSRLGSDTGGADADVDCRKETVFVL